MFNLTTAVYHHSCHPVSPFTALWTELLKEHFLYYRGPSPAESWAPLSGVCKLILFRWPWSAGFPFRKTLFLTINGR